MAKLRVGIIGCGGIANSKHMSALKKIEEVEMVAFCDIILEKAEKAVKEYGTPDAKAYEDYKELLKDKTIDVVHVCTPNRSHSFITIDALESGKHVMCEKPMAKTYEEAVKMCEASERTGKKLSIGYQNRCTAENAYVKACAEKGEFGDMYYANAYAVRRRAVPTWGVFLNEYEQGGGPLIDIGTHALDMTLWIMDNYEPEMVVGQTFRKLADKEEQGNDWGPWDPKKYTVEDSAFGFIKMKNGAVINLQSSWALNVADPDEACYTICGDEGGVDTRNDRVIVNYIKNQRQVIETPSFENGGAAFFEGIKCDDPKDVEARKWVNAILKDTEVPVPPRQALCVTRILEGIYESAKTGVPVYFKD